MPRNNYSSYYSYTSEAFSQPLRNEPIVKPSKTGKKKVKKSGLHYRDVGETSAMFSLYSLITLVIMFAAALAVVMTSAVIVDRQQQIRVLTAELRQVEEDNNMLRTQISQSYDLREIERIASQRLTMGRPQPHQIIHIYVPRTSQTITHIEQHTAEAPRRSILDVLRNWR